MPSRFVATISAGVPAESCAMAPACTTASQPLMARRTAASSRRSLPSARSKGSTTAARCFQNPTSGPADTARRARQKDSCHPQSLQRVAGSATRAPRRSARRSRAIPPARPSDRPASTRAVPYMAGVMSVTAGIPLQRPGRHAGGRRVSGRAEARPGGGQGGCGQRRDGQPQPGTGAEAGPACRLSVTRQRPGRCPGPGSC